MELLHIIIIYLNRLLYILFLGESFFLSPSFLGKRPKGALHSRILVYNLMYSMSDVSIVWCLRNNITHLDSSFA